MTPTVASEMSRRGSSNGNHLALEDRFEVLKEIGDGSFGNVVLARVRTAGANVARRGTVVSDYPDKPYAVVWLLIFCLYAGCHQVDEEDF